MARMVLLCGVWFEMRNVVEGQGRARYCVVWKFVGVVVRGGALRGIVVVVSGRCAEDACLRVSGWWAHQQSSPVFVCSSLIHQSSD